MGRDQRRDEAPGGDADREFAAFVAASTPALLKLAWLLTGDRDAAQDLAQSTYVRTYRAWARVEPVTALAYARRVMTNLHTDWLRRRPWRERPTADLVELIDAHDHSGPGDYEQREVLAAALRGLTARERSTVVLRYYVDLSEAETARVQGVSLGTVKSTTARALRKLGAALTPTGAATFDVVTTGGADG